MSGMISGAVYCNVAFPFDLAKIRMMSKIGEPGLCYRRELGDIYRKEGLYGFTRGYNAMLIRDCGTWMNFGIFDFLKRKLGVNEQSQQSVITHLKKMLAGGLSAVCSFTLFFPFDTIKVKQQTSSERIGMLKFLNTFIRSHGVLALYRGVHV